MERKNKILLFIILVIIILLTLLITYLFIDNKIFNKEENSTKTSTTSKVVSKIDKAVDESKWIKIEQGTAKKMYITKNNDVEIGSVHLTDPKDYNDNYQEVVAIYNCKTNDCTSNYGYGNYIVIKDGQTFIYNIDTKKGKILSDFDNINNINMMTYNNKLYGLYLFNTDNNDKHGVYLIDQEKFTLKDIEIYPNLNDYLFSQGYIGYSNKIYDFYTEELVYTFNMDEEESLCANISSENKNDKTYYIINKDCAGIGDLEIYNDKYERLFEDRIINNYEIDNDGNIYLIDNDVKKYTKYDNEGNKISSSKEYKEILLLLLKDYIAVVDTDNYLKLVDYNDLQVTKFTKWKDSFIFHSMLSGYYTGETKVYGVYLVLEDESIEIGVKGRGKEYYYGVDNGETGVIQIEEIGGYAKPILYLYPEKNNTEINVTFEKPDLLTTTYPKYKNSWNIKANINGTLIDKNNKEYYALYWEESKSKKINYKTGFYVTSENAIKFLEEKLNILGLNDREMNEFIMYWLPILEKNKQSLVYFETTEEREEFNKLNINPKPDSLLRIAIHIKKVNEKVDIKEQILPTFKRTGFTAVEWGGVIDK